MKAMWSTDAVKPGEGFAYWHDVVRQAVLNVNTEPRPEQFRARISWRRFGDMRFTKFQSTGHDLVRSAHHTSYEPTENYLIGLQCEGQSEISQSGDDFILSAGEIGIVNGQLPFRLAFPKTVSRVVAVVPRQALDSRAPWLRRAMPRKIAANAPFLGLVQSHLRQLANDDHELLATEAALLTENLCNLIALATAPDMPTSACSADLQRVAILSFCRLNLGEERLCPALVAARFGISIRTLHMRFAATGQSFRSWLLDRRLEASSAALKDPRERNTDIANIAYRFGFSDLSHFHRTFRARYGMTPRAWRQS
jgi:AraC-like DNA-binding protein